MAAGVRVRGLRELQQAFAAAGKQANKELRDGLRDVAEPVRRDAEALAVSMIPTVGFAWSRMRTGVTRKSVYVAPKQRGVKGRGTGGRRRPKFADRLAEPMELALARNESASLRGIERLMDNVGDRFNRGR